ncbi:MAG: dTMP kinase [Phycisphaerales bacterium]|nr:dTMP kinase [Phycisphaerales bacterium]
MSGTFVVLEGGEGAGKSTQAALLSRWMDSCGIPHVSTREPGGTGVGEAIREIVLGREDLEIPAETELLLILAARAAFVRKVVAPALEEGKVVLADRFSLSTLAYQGFGRGLDLDAIRTGIDIATGGVRPDLTLLLDVPTAVGAARQERSGVGPDRIEREGHAFLDRVQQGYRTLARTEAGVAVVDADGTPEEVQERIRGVLRARFPETFPGPGVYREASPEGGRGREGADA